MAPKSAIKSPPPEVAVLERIFRNAKEDLPPALARYLLKLDFTVADKARMHELAVKNQAGALSGPEKEALLGYASAGCVLGILQSQARQALKKAGQGRTAQNAHG